MFKKSFFLVGLFAMFLTGCVGWSEPNITEHLYGFEAAEDLTVDAEPVGWQLLVEKPVTSSGLNTSQIAVSQKAYQLQYYKNIAWTDTTPVLVQRLLIEAFENSKKIQSVGRENIGLRADYVLRSEVRSFHVINHKAGGAVAAPTEVEISINAKIVKLPQRQIIATHLFKKRVSASSNNFDDIIVVWDQAFQEIQTDIVSWTLAAGDKDAVSHDLYKDGIFTK